MGRDTGGEIPNGRDWFVRMPGPSLSLSLRDGAPGEVQTPPEAAHRETTSAPVLQRVFVYQVYLWAQEGAAVLLYASQQGLDPVAKPTKIPLALLDIFRMQVYIHAPACEHQYNLEDYQWRDSLL